MPLRRFAVCLSFAAILAAASFSVATAQQLVGRIVASVNDDAVTDFDIDARARLLVATSAIEATSGMRQRAARQALRELIDERLKTQEANRLAISVSDQELAAAVQTIERNNRLPPGGLFRELTTTKQVPVETFLDQVKASLAWRKVLRQRVLPQVRVAAEEVDEALARIRTAGGSAIVRVSEIFLPAQTPENFPESEDLAERIAAEAATAANFAQLANRHSRAPTAAVGGDMGELQESQLDPDLTVALAQIEPGQITQPIETDRGVYLLRLAARSEIAAQEKTETVVTLARLALPASSRQTPVELESELANAAAGVDGCDAFERAGATLGREQPPRVVDARIDDLPPDVRSAIEPLQAGETTKVMQIGNSFTVMMLCRRAEVGGEGPTAQSVADALQRQRVARRAERYLRDLRRLAFIDIRG